MKEINVGIVGIGKIARDQHIPRPAGESVFSAGRLRKPQRAR